MRNLIKRWLTYLLWKRIIKAQAGTDENYTANYFISLEKSHLEVIISKAKNELLDFVNLYETLKNNEHQESFIESLAWYIENLKSIIIKWEDALKEINSHEYVNPESSRPTVNDHTYDISEIFPYNIFFASEKLDKEEIMYVFSLMILLSLFFLCLFYYFFLNNYLENVS